MDRTTEKYKQAEQELIYIGRGDSLDNFHERLFNLICKADGNNEDKLSLGYPEFVDVVKRYQNELGYWQELEKRNHK